MVATSSYHNGMQLRTVGVKELKNNLSAYLREVRRGIRIFVSDRGVIVAELREPLQDSVSPPFSTPALADWISSGIVSAPSAKKEKLSLSPVKICSGIALELLEAEREEEIR
jgi:hypothetical protein